MGQPPPPCTGGPGPTASSDLAPADSDGGSSDDRALGSMGSRGGSLRGAGAWLMEGEADLRVDLYPLRVGGCGRK